MPDLKVFTAEQLARINATTITTPKLNAIDMMARLRAIRLYHWQQVKRATKSMAYYRLANWGPRDVSGDPINSIPFDAARERHAAHMRYVQTLNDFFPVGDSAEQDDK